MKTRSTHLLTLGALGVLLAAGSGWARVNVDVHVGVPVAPMPVPMAPAVAVPVPAYPAPQALVMIPNTSVYFVPDVSEELFVSGGYWWTCRDGRWFRARHHAGPWRTVHRREVPGPILHLPPNYRATYVRHEHIPYGQWKKHHGEWAREEGGHGRGHRKERGHGKWDD